MATIMTLATPTGQAGKMLPGKITFSTRIPARTLAEK
jgi:hypothetical protein